MIIRVRNEISRERKEWDSEANAFLHNEILKWKNSKMSGFELKLFRPGRFYKHNFSKNYISDKKPNSKNQVLSSIFEKQDFDEKIISEKIVLTQFEPHKATEFSLFVLILKSMILKQNFSLKIRVWNEISRERKEWDSEANAFLHNEILKWKSSKMSGFELKVFRPGRFHEHNFSNNYFLEKKYFPETQFLSSISIQKLNFDEKFTCE